jgi:hypothetical protein
MTILSNFTFCRNTWFDDSRALQHLAFQKEVFSTFENFPLNHKMYLGNYTTLDVCGKCICLQLAKDIFEGYKILPSHVPNMLNLKKI